MLLNNINQDKDSNETLKLRVNNALSVSSFLQITNNALKNFGIATIQGEISELKLYNHLYFKIKDENAVLDCLMFAQVLNKLNFKLEVGMQVVIQGSSAIYAKNGQFRFIVQHLSIAGRGLIMERLIKLKERLEAEGVFNRLNRKIPMFVNTVGIITSKEGRVVHDITSTLCKRNPLIKVIIYDAKVQGDDAPQSLLEALNLAYEQRLCDVLIIGRGGGSFEDLLAFSDESLVRAVSLSPIPIISAVGHEPDFALTDFAADKRAPTPTAAAQFVSEITIQQIQEAIINYEQRLNANILKFVDSYRMRLDKLLVTLELKGPMQKIAINKLALNNICVRLDSAIAQIHKSRQIYLAKLQDKIVTLAPERKLNLYKQRLLGLENNLNMSMQAYIFKAKERLKYNEFKVNAGIDNYCNVANRRITNAYNKVLSGPTQITLANLDKRLSSINSKLIALNPLAILQRGYSYTINVKTKKVVSANLQRGDSIKTVTSFGEIISLVDKVTLKTDGQDTK